MKSIYIEYEKSFSRPNIIILSCFNNKYSITYIIANEIVDVVEIKKEIFDEIYSKILNLNFKEIVIANKNYCGLDGSRLKLTIGGDEDTLTINIWSINHNTKERNLEDLYNIITKITSILGLKDFFN